VKRYFGATFASLRIRNYRLYFIGQSISFTGTWMQKLAQAWLVLELTNSGAWLGATLALQQLPTLLLAPWGGVLADRFSKRTIMIWTAAAAMVPAVLLGLLTLTDTTNIYLVMGLVLLGGFVDAFDKPARQSFPSEMVDRPRLANAVLLNNVVQDTGRVVGPAIAGLLIAAVGLAPTFFINAVSFVTVIVGLFLMRPDELAHPPRPPRSKGDLRAGLAYVRANPQLLGPLALLGCVGLVALNFQVLIPLLGHETFGGDARTVGYLLSAFGAGSVIGGLALAGVLSASVGRIIGAAVVLGVLFIATGLSPTVSVALGAVFVLGAGTVAYKALTSTWLQLTAAPAMRGRVLALLVVAMGGTTPVGAPLVGWLAEHFGTRLTFVIAGACTAVAALVAYFYARRVATRGRDTQGADEVVIRAETSSARVGRVVGSPATAAYSRHTGDS
jgi:MFS family permease